MNISHVVPRHIQVGRLGEDIAVKWLTARGFTVLERNYNKKWGEIDTVVSKRGKVHFVEVKTVSHETKEALEESVSRGTNPAENVHYRKQQRLGRAIQTWQVGKGSTGDFQIDVLTVRLVPREKYAVVESIENVVFE